MSKPAMKMGRLANGNEADQGSVVHLVPDTTEDYGFTKALCGTEPGRRSGGWNIKITRTASCKRCISKQEKPTKWISVLDRLPGEGQVDIIVTNNLGSHNAYGRLSHCWLVLMIHKQDDGSYSAFDEADRRIHGITHWFDPFE